MKGARAAVTPHHNSQCWLIFFFRPPVRCSKKAAFLTGKNKQFNILEWIIHNWGSLMSSVMPSYLKYNLSCEDIYLHVKTSIWLRMISEQRQHKAPLLCDCWTTVRVPPKGTQQDPLSHIKSVCFLCCVPVRSPEHTPLMSIRLLAVAVWCWAGADKRWAEFSLCVAAGCVFCRSPAVAKSAAAKMEGSC